MSEDGDPTPSNRFRNKNVVSKEKRTAKNRKTLDKLGIADKALSKEQEVRVKRRARAERLRKGLAMLREGIQNKIIAEKLNVHANTVAGWKSKYKVELKPEIPEEQPDPDAFKATLSREAKQNIDEMREQAQEEEQQDIDEVAEKAITPADQWQSYVASQGMRMMRDSIPQIRGPRTVKEFAELDSVVRRSMGLSNTINPKGGGGAGNSLTIDVNVLNNTRATKGGASSVVVDAEVLDNKKA